MTTKRKIAPRKSKSTTSARKKARKLSNSKHIQDNGAYFKNDYRTGQFKSKKNQDIMTYRSSFEFAYMTKLEKDTRCLGYASEPFKIRYIDADGAIKNYIPDLLVLWNDGSTELIEIKPKAMIRAGNVQRKAKAAVHWLKKYYPETKFKFITEDHIFDSKKDYQELLKSLK